jgi:hypothetical protein
MLEHITLTHWILRNKPVYKRDKISEQDGTQHRRMYFHHHRSIRSTNRHRTNNQADFAGSKQLCTQHGLIGEHTLNPSTRESKSSAHDILLGLSIFQHDPDNPP